LSFLSLAIRPVFADPVTIFDDVQIIIKYSSTVYRDQGDFGAKLLPQNQLDILDS